MRECVAVCCSHSPTHCNTLTSDLAKIHCNTLQHTATHCNTPATHQKQTLPKRALHCVLQCVAVCCTHFFTHYNTFTSDLAEMRCNTLQHTATHCNTPATGLAETLPSAPTLLFIQEVTPTSPLSAHTPPFFSFPQHSLFGLSRTK